MQRRVLLLLLGSWHTHGVAKWVLAGLGHCTVPLEILQNKDLAGCLRSCEVAGKRCSYVSFLDDALIRRKDTKDTSSDLDDLAMRPQSSQSPQSPKPERQGWQGANGGSVGGVLDGAFSGGTLCLHFAHCGALKSTLSGSATFLREDHVDEERGWPEDDVLVTISTGRSMSSRRTWQLRKQLCVSAELGEPVAALKDVCADSWTVKYVSGPVMASHMVDSTAAVRVTIQRGKHFLCSRSASSASSASTPVWLSESCGLDTLGTWDVVRAGENQEVVDSEPCVWLRAAHDGNFTHGQYLSVSEDHRDHRDHRLTFLPWSTDMSASCWNFGHEQTWMQHNFVGREDFEIHAETDTSCKPTHATQVTQCQEGDGARQKGTTFGAMRRVRRVPHIWLMASPKYTETMQRLLSTFQRAQEPVRVSVRWVPDFKDTKRTGFILTGKAPQARRVYAFNYLKLLFLFEAYLDGVQSEDDMVVVMDLDVQVRRGWTRTLEKCMEDAEICFLQQAAFGDRWQQANSGVLVFKPTAAVGAFYHALGARLQGQEILVRLLPSMDAVAFEQLLLNYMLQQIRGLVNFTEAQGEMSNLTTVRWGIYSPLVAYSGMFLTAAVLTDTVHHATASNADLRSKLRLMDGAELFVADLREFCPLDPSGSLEITGPLLEFCYYFIGVDPHFGPLLDHYRVHRGFSETDNLVVLDHLQTRARGRKAWIQAVISFNEGGYKYYKAKRRNSSAVLGDALLHPAF